jgi:thiamine pyrophosphokinase
MPAEGMQIHGRTQPSSHPEEGFLVRAVIFANGDFKKTSIPLSSLREDDLLIAADGGAQHLQELGLRPTTVIGDMDSISPTLLNDLKTQGTQLIVYPRDKDQTDLELALTYAVQSGVQEVLFFGVLGGRLDQSLANLMLLTRDDWKDLSLVISNAPDFAFMMRDHNTTLLHGNPGDIVSLIPLSAVVTEVTTHGLRWPLKNAELTLGNTISVSNEMLEKSARIEIGIGKLLLVHRDILAAENEE